MSEKDLQSKIIKATKWSALTEIAAKLVQPITNMVLARIIAPEAFGVIATITMIVSFADMFTDSGFQKYLVQHNFKDDNDKNKNANVAFWTNIGISIFLWGIIFLFRDQIAIMVGNPGLGNVLAIAAFQLPLTSFSSIQMALYRRDFDFKTLFLVRMVSVFIPIIVTIPLAFLGLNYWALIIGTLLMQTSNAIILTLKSKWKPQLFYNFNVLKKMFSFSVWSLIEAVSIWLTVWVDTFIIGIVLNQYFLGLYKTSTMMVNTLMALVTSALVPVLFSALSRLQDDNVKFNKLYFKFQRIVSILVFPLGVGVFLFSDLATRLILGDQWGEASKVIGHWALSSSVMIVFGYFGSEVYRAKGKPKLSFLAQMLHLVVLVPTIIISSKYGFWVLVFARSWIRMQFVLVHMVIMKYVIGIPILKTIKNVLPTLSSALAMGILGYLLLQVYEGLLWNILSIIICVLFYFVILLLNPNMRKEISTLIIKIIPVKVINKLKLNLIK